MNFTLWSHFCLSGPWLYDVKQYWIRYYRIKLIQQKQFVLILYRLKLNIYAESQQSTRYSQIKLVKYCISLSWVLHEVFTCVNYATYWRDQQNNRSQLLASRPLLNRCNNLNRSFKIPVKVWLSRSVTLTVWWSFLAAYRLLHFCWVSQFSALPNFNSMANDLTTLTNYFVTVLRKFLYETRCKIKLLTERFNLIHKRTVLQNWFDCKKVFSSKLTISISIRTISIEPIVYFKCSEEHQINCNNILQQYQLQQHLNVINITWAHEFADSNRWSSLSVTPMAEKFIDI